jgi:ribosome recycling factor
MLKDEMNDYATYETKMKKTLAVLSDEFNSIRAGRANPSILDRVLVDYYGAPTAINQMAAISVPEARTLTIQPWDTSALKSIERAIQASDLGINPNNDGKVIRLTFPPLTEERRKEITKRVQQLGEESKIAIRAVRREAIEYYKGLEKKSEITEDDLRRTEKDIQDLTDKYCKEIDKMTAQKETDIMAV